MEDHYVLLRIFLLSNAVLDHCTETQPNFAECHMFRKEPDLKRRPRFGGPHETWSPRPPTFSWFYGDSCHCDEIKLNISLSLLGLRIISQPTGRVTGSPANSSRACLAMSVKVDEAQKSPATSWGRGQNERTMDGRLWFIVPRAPLAAVPLLAAHIDVKWRVLRASRREYSTHCRHHPIFYHQLLTRASICRLRRPYVVSCYYFFRRLCPLTQVTPIKHSCHSYRATNRVKPQWLVCLKFKADKVTLKLVHFITVETETVIKLFSSPSSPIILVFFVPIISANEAFLKEVCKSFEYTLDSARENFCSFSD